MPRSRSIFLGLLITVVMVTAIGYWILDRRQYEATDNAYLRSNIVLISPKVQGYVTALAIDDNQAVKQGEVLVTIDDRDYQAKVAQAEADITAEQAHIRRLQAMKISQQARVEAARANITASKARQEQTKKDLKRFTNLINRGSASAQSLDKIQSESKQTTAELRAMHSTLEAEQNQLATLDIEIAETEARLKNAQAQLRLAEIEREHTKVRAPVDGIIGKRGVQLGQLVRPGVTLAYLIENHKIWVEANFKETSWNTCARDKPYRSRSMPIPNLNCTARSTALRRPAVRNSASCRPKTPRAISLKSCAGYRSRLSSTTARTSAC
jgi:membrane fusion protein, multidrug efflux system